jgi:ABC-type Fe3+/spermidine/putrescine transport system ATPase subunit
VLQAGAPASVYAEPRDATAAMMTGPANILAGTLRQKLPGGFVWVSAGLRFSQADCAGQPSPGLGTPVSICLRPGQIAVAPGPVQDPGPNCVSGTVTRLTCREDRVGVLCGSALGPVQAMSAAPAALRAGMDAVLGWAPEAGWVLAP